MLAYKLLHLFGMFLLFTGLGALVGAAATSGGARGELRRFGLVAHGVGLLVMLVAGFGLLARLEYGFPGWVLAKIGLWVVLGLSAVAIKKMGERSVSLLWVFPVLGLAAAWLAVWKPF